MSYPSYLGSIGGVGLVKEGPYLGLDPLPAVQLPRPVFLLPSKLLHDVLLRRFVCVQVQPIQDGQHVLSVPVLGVGHPAARLHLVRIQPPELEFFLKQRATDIGGVVELPCAVVVEDLREHPRVAVEEVLVKYGVIVGQRLGQSGETRGWNLL